MPLFPTPARPPRFPRVRAFFNRLRSPYARVALKDQPDEVRGAVHGVLQVRQAQKRSRNIGAWTGGLVGTAVGMGFGMITGGIGLLPAVLIAAGGVGAGGLVGRRSVAPVVHQAHEQLYAAVQHAKSVGKTRDASLLLPSSTGPVKLKTSLLKTNKFYSVVENNGTIRVMAPTRRQRLLAWLQHGNASKYWLARKTASFMPGRQRFYFHTP